jgi:outer membrane protein
VHSIRKILVGVALATAFAAPAMAQLKIGVVDYQRVFATSPQTKAMDEAMNAEYGPRAQQIEAAKQAFKTRGEKLQKDSATMTADQKSRAEKELRDTARDIERKQQEFEQDLNDTRRNEMRKLESALIAEVQEYAKAQNFDLVIAKSAVFYSTSAVDITPAVLAAMQARTPRPAAAPAATTPAAKPPAKP